MPGPDPLPTPADLEGAGMPPAAGERRALEETLRTVALGVSAATGEALFRAVVRYLSIALGVDFAFVGELLEPSPARVRTLALAYQGEVVDNQAYELRGTPCERVVGQGFQFIPEGVCRRYPGDNMLTTHALEGYAGHPLWDSAGRALGIVAVVNREPLRDRELVESMLRIFAVRAAAELERLRVEQALRASEASYRAIFEGSEDAIFVHDLDTGAILDVNPKACAAYGYTCEEMRRIGVGALGSGEPPYTLEGALHYLERARAGEPQRFEWHRRTKDGSLHWDEVCLKRMTIGGVDRIIALTREITERKEREEALRKSEDRLRATVEAAIDCILGVDAEGRILELNPAAERCFGLRREQALGRPLGDLLILERHGPDHHRGPARWAAARAAAFLGQRIEVTGRRADGSEFPAELALALAHGPEGAIFVGYLRDITGRQRAEAERARLEAQLRQAQKMEAIGQLTGGIAHDFNNILTGVLGYVALARERVEPLGDQKLLQYLERAERSGQRARDLIRQMLTFSRGRRGEPRPLALAPLVVEAVKLLGPTFPATVEFRTELATDTAPVLMDPVQAEQVLMNLCINARDAMGAQGQLTVSLRPTCLQGAVCASCRQAFAGEFVELAVRDTGPGIPPGAIDRLFEPFFTTKDLGKGSGMGLAVVHGIVHEHGGHVLVDTAPGAGASFRIALRPMDQPVEPEPLPRAGAPAPGARLAGRVLLADDDEAAGGFMEDLLASWGLEVERARDGAEARARFARDPARFDLAVLDQSMPRVAGLALAGELLALRPDLPVVLCTGYAEGLSAEAVHARGVRALLGKPLDPTATFALLQELLPARAP
jgi:PAS domain S-box-containing protein